MPEQAAPPRSALVLKGPGGRRPRLLLAEDCDPIRVVTTAMLKGMGCDVDAVIHGEEAVRLATDHTFDVIVLDIEMPIMDGITAARFIRDMPEKRGTPIMALSAFVADAMQSGQLSDTFDIALPKPANRNELHAAVQAALDFHEPEAVSSKDESPVVCEAQCAGLKRALGAEAWRGLVAIACADIEANMQRLEEIVSGRMAGSRSVPARRLAALGRTFAAPKLMGVAVLLDQVMGADEELAIVRQLKAVAAQTVAELHRS
ncbi:response regulator [Aestuariivirga sp.]|uniref:response regulator n=1 Tax=Aestuariivirga sp. TaxID=2650926 RepID=UPI0039E6C8B5